MNIKIFTFYYTNNYGASIQALSLKEFLSKNYEADVNFSTYQSKKLLFREIYRPIIKKNLIDAFKNIIKSYRLKNWKKKNNLPRPIYNQEINHSSISIYGSDSIWHTFSYLGFQPYYFGNKNNGFKISYATSIGPTNFDNTDDVTLEKIRELLNEYDHISVRDTNTAKLVKKMTGKDPLVVVDPIFLTDLNFIDYSKDKIEKFVLVYGTVFSKEDKTKIINFCKSKDLKIISIGYYNNWADENYIHANPDEFLSYVSNADYIFTSMFHGIMFSVKFKKKFWHSADRIRTNKIEYFINNLNLSNRLINKSENFENEIDYELLYEKLNPWIETSKDFLKKCLEKKNLS
jgi:hypothetical protein